MTTNQLPMTATAHRNIRDDRVLPEVRLIAPPVLFLLLLAISTVYVVPAKTIQNWAWTIDQPINGFAIGAGYLMGMWFFLRVLFAQRWHWIAAGFPAIVCFTLSMLLATIVHWDRFLADRLAYYLWIVVYIITPPLVAFLWWRNRMTDPGPGAVPEIIVPLLVRQAFGVGGALILAFSVLAFIFPALLIDTFTWPLTDFSARLMAGWLSIAGVGGITLALEPRWTGWRVLLEAAYVGIVAFVLALPRAWSDLMLSRPSTWIMLLGLAGVLVGFPVFYLLMGRRERAPEGARP